MVDCIFEHVGLDASNLIRDAVGATDNGAAGKYNVVKACGCAVAELEVFLDQLGQGKTGRGRICSCLHLVCGSPWHNVGHFHR